MAIDLIVFGLDNGLFNTENAHLESSNQAFENCGLSYRWTIEQYRSAALDHGASGAISAVVGQMGYSKAAREAAALFEEKTRLFHELACQGRIALHTGYANLIDDALENGCKLAIATDLPASTATALLEQVFTERLTELFAAIASAVNFGSSWGNNPYHLLLRTIGADPWRSVAIESSAPALLAAQRAGLWTLATTPFADGVEGVAGADSWWPHLRAAGSSIPGTNMADGADAQLISFDVLDSMQAATRINPMFATSAPGAWA